MRSERASKLVEIFGDEEGGRASRALLAQRRVDRFGGADVDAAGGVDGDDEPRLAGQLATEQELLLIAAGEGAQFGPAARRLDVVVGNEAVGEGRDRLARKERAAAQRRPA